MAGKRILLATDFDSALSPTVAAACRLALTLGAAVHVLSVVAADPSKGETAAEAKAKMDRAVRSVRSRGVTDVDSSIETGVAVDVIARHANPSEFELVVIGSHGRGTTVAEVVGRSLVPVMAVPEDAPHDDAAPSSVGIPFKHILVPTDFEGAAENALKFALTLAARFSSKVTLVHAERPPSTLQGSRASSPEFELNARTALDAVVERAKLVYPSVESVLSIGSRWERILEVAKQRGADLIVMGTNTHGSALPRWVLGSVADRVVSMAKVPVLTVSA